MTRVQHHCATLGADLVAEKDIDAGIVIFRGIPYASVSERWTQSCIRRSLPSIFDATKFGPRCPQPSHPSMFSMGLEQPVVEADEFDCLNLNITVPLGALPEAGQKGANPLLPVMVWVHGGRFTTGSNSDVRFQPQVLSSLAKEAGHPVVVVQINYRLGVLGFAASSDLASEYRSTTSKPSLTNQPPDYFGNFGLLDQLNAFQWVQDYIRDFGGDPSNVTAFGSSAGGGSLHLHILAGKALFDRAILMSGSAPSMGPFPLEHLDAGWTNLCKNSGVLADTCEKRLEKLRSLSADDLSEKYGLNALLTPVADGKLLPTSLRLGEPHPNSRCKDIIIGDTKMEGIIFDGMISYLPQNLFRGKVLAAFATASDANLFCKYFGFTPSEEQPHEAYRDAMRFFLSVVLFHFPSLRVAESYAGNTYLYHFDEPSPYAGPTHGLAVHGQCTIFLYNNERKVWPESAQRISLEMANMWAAFAYGKGPWEPYPASKRFMRFGPSGECRLRSLEDDEVRDYRYLSWLREHHKEAVALVHSLK